MFLSFNSIADSSGERHAITLISFAKHKHKHLTIRLQNLWPKIRSCGIFIFWFFHDMMVFCAIHGTLLQDKGQQVLDLRPKIRVKRAKKKTWETYQFAVAAVS